MNKPCLTINYQPFDQHELGVFSINKVKNQDTPAWEKSVYEFILLWLREEKFIAQNSSGTTGKSKKLLLQKQSMLRSAEKTCFYFDLHRGQTALLCLPVNYIAGKMMVVRSITAGLNLILTEPRSNPSLNTVDEIDFCAMVPLQVLNLFKPGKIYPHIRKLLIGGAEISPELENRVRDLPSEVYATYGMAETCSHVALRKINGPLPDPSYQALPGIEFETDERGCLVITTDYLPAPVITNDQVQLEGNDRFRWIGRYDNLINSGAIKISPEELELSLGQKTGITCTLIGLPDHELGQRLIVVAEKTKVKDADSMVRTELQRLLPRKLQLKIVWIDKFPRNKSFKVDRKKLAGLISQMV